ncbi:hypothetical protein E2542_SST28379 [Spatholobus suberectus]|nr:hypothetical protein E2542_SST28379 [Spatholobus suberectus]
MDRALTSVLHSAVEWRTSLSQGQSMDQEKHWKKQQYNPSGVRVLEGSNGDKLPRKTNAPSEHPHEVGNKT